MTCKLCLKVDITWSLRFRKIAHAKQFKHIYLQTFEHDILFETDFSFGGKVGVFVVAAITRIEFINLSPLPWVIHEEALRIAYKDSVHDLGFNLSNLHRCQSMKETYRCS